LIQFTNSRIWYRMPILCLYCGLSPIERSEPGLVA
jgi:hypothetical protein